MDKRIHVVLSNELMTELDRLVGKRARSRFIEEAVSARLKSERQRAAIRAATGTLNRENHPEFATPELTSKWVHDMRRIGDDGKIPAWVAERDEKDEKRSATS